MKRIGGTKGLIGAVGAAIVAGSAIGYFAWRKANATGGAEKEPVPADTRGDNP